LRRIFPSPPRAEIDAANWFLSSGIQDSAGGVSRYYRGDSGIRLPNSTEITGYATGGLLFLGQPQAARRAANFLLQAWDGESQVFPFELEGSARFAFFFDTGIIARGLLALWRRDGGSDLLTMAEKAGESMAGHFRDASAAGGYHPILSLPSRSPLPHEPWWSKNPGAFQLKAALAWRELAEISGNQAFESHYRRQLAFSLRSLRALIDAEPDRLKVMDRLHPYCYFLEGLMPEAAQHKDALAAGIAEVGRRLLELRGEFVRSEVYAQLLRVRLLAAQADLVPLDSEAAAEEARELASFQLQSEDPRLAGAFAFGSRNGVVIPHANPVSTIFAAQALAWWDRWNQGRWNETWRDLV
jgi:hypothetical protein